MRALAPAACAFSVRSDLHPAWVIFAELICSDEECAVIVEAVDDVRALEMLVCEDCGCWLHVVSLSEATVVEAWIPAPPLALAA